MIRSNRNLDIDMRIGVHSGSLMAGVMGAAKLQYDVWGKYDRQNHYFL